MENNKALWDAAFVTDPKAVKPITGKSYKGDSPKPYYLIERATELFGPIGIGWGVTVKSEQFVNMPGENVLHVATVAVWYVWEGKRSETFEQMGGTKACYPTAAGKLMIDEDAGKKSVTDGMVKCLSMIGFAGDIFSGLWNDSKYVEWAGTEVAKRQGGAAPAANNQSQNLSISARAAKVSDGVEGGYAREAALDISSWPQRVIDEVFALLTDEVAEQLRKNWPKD